MRLRQIREARGLSLAALGEMVGKDQSTIHRAERMDKTAKLDTYIRCADALGVSLEDLFTDRTDLERLLIEAFRSLPEDRQMGWADMARSVLAERRD